MEQLPPFRGRKGTQAFELGETAPRVRNRNLEYLLQACLERSRNNAKTLSPRFGLGLKRAAEELKAKNHNLETYACFI